MDKLRVIATDGVAWLVCLLVTFTSFAKMAEPIGTYSDGPTELCINWGVEIPHGRGSFGVVRPIQKHCKSLRRTLQKKSIMASFAVYTARVIIS